jgi:cytidylate kinase
VIIAVDGPAASGKGTIARALAAHYGLPHLDTGLLYRAVGIGVACADGDPDNEADALAACNFDIALLSDPVLRSEEAGPLASRVSRHHDVRAALFERQRAFAMQPGGAVLDGRDIGTVIAPDADAKLFVTASTPVRAQRRHDELLTKGEDVRLDAIEADLIARDVRDTQRAEAPLKQAEDADLLDTSDLSIGAAVQRAIALVDARLKDRT